MFFLPHYRHIHTSAPTAALPVPLLSQSISLPIKFTAAQLGNLVLSPLLLFSSSKSSQLKKKKKQLKTRQASSPEWKMIEELRATLKTAPVEVALDVKWAFAAPTREQLWLLHLGVVYVSNARAPGWHLAATQGLILSLAISRLPCLNVCHSIHEAKENQRHTRKELSSDTWSQLSAFGSLPPYPSVQLPLQVSAWLYICVHVMSQLPKALSPRSHPRPPGKHQSQKKCWKSSSLSLPFYRIKEVRWHRITEQVYALDKGRIWIPGPGLGLGWDECIAMSEGTNKFIIKVTNVLM